MTEENTTVSDETVTEEAEPAARELSSDFKWYIAHALSGFENRVTKTLKERILNYNKSDFFADIIVPEESVVTNVNGKKRNIKKKCFPGYVLIRMIMNEETWHLVKDTDKVTGFIGGERGRPIPISNDDANNMIGNVDEGGTTKRARSTSTFSAGDSVKVTEGPFASFVGIVEAVNTNGKLKVNVSIFGRPTPVELDDTQVEKQ